MELAGVAPGKYQFHVVGLLEVLSLKFTLTVSHVPLVDELKLATGATALVTHVILKNTGWSEIPFTLTGP